MSPSEDFAFYAPRAPAQPRVAGDIRSDFRRSEFVWRLMIEAGRRGKRGRRGIRKLEAYALGMRSIRGDLTPFEKLTYQRMWARGAEHAHGYRHQTFRPASVRHCNPGWIRRTLARRRRGTVNWSIRVDATPAFDSLRKLRERLMAYQPPANPKKECPPPCP